jgi:hypothetical protein
MNIIGIDPGKDGGIVVLNERGEIIEQQVMPLIADTELDVIAIKNIIVDNEPCTAFIEDVHAIYGAAAGSTFTFGGIVHSLNTIVKLLKIRHIRVQPKAWQAMVYQGVAEIRKPSKSGKKGKVDTKAMSEIAAKRLYPAADLRKNDKCRVVHDGIVDALLIAHYGHRTLKQAATA